MSIQSSERILRYSLSASAQLGAWIPPEDLELSTHDLLEPTTSTPSGQLLHKDKPKIPFNDSQDLLRVELA